MRFKMNQIRMTGILALTLTVFAPGFALAKSALVAEQREARLNHAQELLGRYYSRSVVRTGEEVAKINGFVYRTLRSYLPKKFKSKYQNVAQAVIDESLKWEFDPIFLLAVIGNESSYNPAAKGPVDEIGLMQLRPATAKWIAEREGLKWQGNKTLRDPVMNVRIGAAYLAMLRDQFDSHARLYISAYNMGGRNVRKNLEQNQWPKAYTSRVMKHYVDLYSQLKEKQKPQREVLERRVAARDL